MADSELAAMDLKLAEMARLSRPDGATLRRLNERIVAASVTSLPVPVSIPIGRMTRSRTGLLSRMALGGRTAMAASLVMAFGVAGLFRGGMPVAFVATTTSTESTTALPDGQAASETSASETALVALMQEPQTRGIAAISSVVDPGSVAQVSPVLMTRSASYDDFAAEMDAMLGDLSGSSL